MQHSSWFLHRLKDTVRFSSKAWSSTSRLQTNWQHSLAHESFQRRKQLLSRSSSLLIGQSIIPLAAFIPLSLYTDHNSTVQPPSQSVHSLTPPSTPQTSNLPRISGLPALTEAHITLPTCPQSFSPSHSLAIILFPSSPLPLGMRGVELPSISFVSFLSFGYFTPAYHYIYMHNISLKLLFLEMFFQHQTLLQSCSWGSLVLYESQDSMGRPTAHGYLGLKRTYVHHGGHITEIQPWLSAFSWSRLAAYCRRQFSYRKHHQGQTIHGACESPHELHYVEPPTAAQSIASRKQYSTWGKKQ